MEQKISNINLYENLWFVSKSSYESCKVRGGMDRAITKCDSPLELRYETIVFQRYTAAEDGLQFLPGKEYYFIGSYCQDFPLLTFHCHVSVFKLRWLEIVFNSL